MVKDDTVECPRCERAYSFIRCRITDSKGKNLCLACAVDDEKLHPKK